MAELLTVAQRLAKEPLDRVMGRLSNAQRQGLAYTWASRAVRDVAPPFLEAAGLGPTAEAMRKAPEATDEGSGHALISWVKQVYAAVDSERLKEEAAAGGQVTQGAAATAARAASLALEAVRAAQGLAGMKVAVTVVAGLAGGGTRPLLAPDDTLQRAIMAERYLTLIAKLGGDDVGQEEEARHKEDAVSVLTQPRRVG